MFKLSFIDSVNEYVKQPLIMHREYEGQIIGVGRFIIVFIIMEELYDKHNRLIEKYSETHPNLTNLWKNIISLRKDNYESLLKQSISLIFQRNQAYYNTTVNE